MKVYRNIALWILAIAVWVHLLFIKKEAVVANSIPHGGGLCAYYCDYTGRPLFNESCDFNDTCGAFYEGQHIWIDKFNNIEIRK